MSLKVSPVTIPNPVQQLGGWDVDAQGIFYIHQINVSQALGTPNILQLLHPISCFQYVQEVISPTIDHAILGTYEQAKTNEPHVQSYYHAAFDVYIIHG